MVEEVTTWRKLVEPHVRRFEVAAKFNGTASYNATGSAAMAELLKKMAETIDKEILTRAAVVEHGRREGEIAQAKVQAMLDEFHAPRRRADNRKFVTRLYRAHSRGK